MQPDTHTHPPPLPSLLPLLQTVRGRGDTCKQQIQPQYVNTSLHLHQAISNLSPRLLNILMETPASPLPTWALCYVINPNLTTGCRQGMRYAHLFSAYKLRCLFKYFSCQLLIKPQPCNASPGFHHKGVFVPAFFFFFKYPKTMCMANHDWEGQTHMVTVRLW